MRNVVYLIAVFASSSVLAGPKIHVSKQLAHEKAGCVDYLVNNVEEALLDLLEPNATVNLGEYDELEKLLIKAGTDRKSAKSAVGAVAAVRAAARNFPVLRFTSEVFDSLIENKKLFVCTISKKCSLARAEANYMLFTQQHEAIVLMPPPDAGPQKFAINLFSTLGTNAGERFLTFWLAAGFTKQSRSAGSVDQYYREFASSYDGTYPPNPSSLKDGFAITFMTLFQMQISESLFAHYYPSEASFNHAHLANHIFAELMYGRNKEVTAPIMRELKMTEAGLFNKADEMFDVMLRTIEDVIEGD